MVGVVMAVAAEGGARRGREAVMTWRGRRGELVVVVVEKGSENLGMGLGLGFGEGLERKEEVGEALVVAAAMFEMKRGSASV